MSIQYMDNFQFYGLDEAKLTAGTPWGNIYSGSNLVDDPDPNADADSKALQYAISGTGASVNRLALPSPGQQQGVACRIWWSDMPSGVGHGGGIQYNTSGNLPMYLVSVTPTGALRLIRRDKSGWTTSGDTVVDETGPLVVGAGAWYHIEWFMDTATGDYEVRVEGVTVLDGNDAAHHSDSMGIFVLVNKWECTAAGEPTHYCKDLILWDDTGTVNNTFIGPVSVYSLQVSGDTSSGWTRSTGATDYGLLDELTPDDTDYISASDALPAASIMTLENLPADIVGVRAVQTVVRAKKTDGGDATMVVSMISNGDLDDGAAKAVTTSFRYHWDVSELDPDTAAQWTPVGVNAASIKINRTV